MAADEEQNRFWREERETFFDFDPRPAGTAASSRSTSSPGCASRIPRSSRRRTRRCFELVGDGLVQGLRIDHPDGLADPRGYLERLRERGVEHVWVEKILEPGERLRDWPVEGTTGLRVRERRHGAVRRPGRRRAAHRALRGAHGRAALVRRRSRARRSSSWRAATSSGSSRTCGGSSTDPGSRRRPRRCTSTARTSSRGAGASRDEDREALAAVPDDLRRILLLEERGHDEFVTRFQQTTGPVMAKGVEDTAFYRWLRLTALNEVGGNPDRFTLPVDEFHRANLEREERFPRHLLATQTHDTKRSGDVRARIVALAWLADEWLERRRGWRRARRSRRGLPALADARRRLADRARAGRGVHGEGAARGEAEHELDRAERGARARGSREAIGRALRRAARRTSSPSPSRVAEVGRRISLGMTLLKLTVPGRARHLPGRRARGAEPRRPGQPAAGRLGAPPAGARRGAERARHRRTRRRSCA